MNNISDPLSPLPVYPGTKPRFHAMVEPMGAICNLDCCIFGLNRQISWLPLDTNL